jgi:hypothetical protein
VFKKNNTGASKEEKRSIPRRNERGRWDKKEKRVIARR